MASRTRSRSTLRQRSVEHSVKLSKSNPASRSSSPAPGNRRIAKLNMYLSKSQRGSATNLSGFMEPLAAPSQIREIKRWDGNRRLSAKWDSVRRVRIIQSTYRLPHSSDACRIPSFGSRTATVLSIFTIMVLHAGVLHYEFRSPTWNLVIVGLSSIVAIANQAVLEIQSQTPTDPLTCRNTLIYHRLQEATSCTFQRQAITRGKRPFNTISLLGTFLRGCMEHHWLATVSVRPSSPFRNA